MTTAARCCSACARALLQPAVDVKECARPGCHKIFCLRCAEEYHHLAAIDLDKILPDDCDPFDDGDLNGLPWMPAEGDEICDDCTVMVNAAAQKFTEDLQEMICDRS